MKKKLVEVTWVDIETTAGWTELPDKDLVPCKSYGLLVSNGRKELILASTYDPELKKWGDRHRFPKGCVQSVRVIEVVNV